MVLSSFGPNEVNGFLHLKRIALRCLFFQLVAAIVFLFCSIISPESHQVAVACGVLAILTSLVPILYVFLTKKVVLIFSCLCVFNLAPIWFLYLEAVLPGYDAYTFSQPVFRMESFFWVAVFQIFVNLFYLLFWESGSKFSIRTFSFLNKLRLKSDFYGWITLLAFALPLVGYYFYFGSVETLWIYLTGGRSGGSEQVLQESGGGALLSPLNWLLQLAPLFGTIAFISAKQKYSFTPIISLFVALLVIFIYFLSGTRSIMLFVAAPVFFYFFYYNWHKGFKFWFSALTLFFLLIGVMELQVRFRGDLLSVIADPQAAARHYNLSSATTFDPSKSHRDNNTYLLCLLIKGTPDKYSYQGFHDFFAILVNPIPRIIWPDKPLLVGARELAFQPQWVLDGPLLMGTTSLSFSVVGEAYLASGIWGLLIYASVYGLFLIFFDGIIYYIGEKQVLAVGILGVGLFLSLWGFRSFFALITFIYPIMLLIVISRFVLLLRKFKIKWV
jgi:hypothetical protein